MRKLLLVLVVAAVGGSPLAAQALGESADWSVQFDRPHDWQVIPGSNGVAYHVDRTASGTYRIESEVFLSKVGEHKQVALGILFGGQNLPDDSQSYTYFVIRNDGQFSVKLQIGTLTTDVVDWTPHPAIITNARGIGAVRNVLAVEAGPIDVTFYINGETVTAVRRRAIELDGVVGLRLTHVPDLEGWSLTVTARAAG